MGQLDRASTSIPLNIAEGNAKRSNRDRGKYLDIANGSALECAAALDVLVARQALLAEQIPPGKALLVRIVEMLTKMTLNALGPNAGVVQEGLFLGNTGRVGAGPSRVGCPSEVEERVAGAQLREKSSNPRSSSQCT